MEKPNFAVGFLSRGVETQASRGFSEFPLRQHLGSPALACGQKTRLVAGMSGKSDKRSTTYHIKKAEMTSVYSDALT